MNKADYDVSLLLQFDNRINLNISGVWRLQKNNEMIVSDGDHNQIYGLEKPIDAVAVLNKELKNKKVIEIEIDKYIGDIKIMFEDNYIFKVFNNSGYELWSLTYDNIQYVSSSGGKVFYFRK